MAVQNTSSRKYSRQIRRGGSPKLNTLRRPQSFEERGDAESSVDSMSSDRMAFETLALAAATYAELGYHVLPLHTIRDGACTCRQGAACTKPGKHPLLEGGYKTATSDVAEVRRIWSNHPNANIGIATGRVSGIIALDVDPRNGGDKTLRHLSIELGRLPSTVRVRTGGRGSHWFYSYPKVPIKTKHWPAGIDLQSDGSHIVAPPSLHATGRHYRFRSGRDPHSITLAPLPEAWLTHLKGASEPVADSPDGATEGRIPEGERNTRLTKQAGALHRVGASEAALMAALNAENAARCVPPLDEAEIAKIVGSVMRYPAAAGDGDQAETVMQLVLDQHFAGGAHLLLAFDARFWWYDGTVWAPLSDKVLSGRVLATIQGLPARPKGQTAPLMGQVVRLIEAKVAADGDLLRFNAPPLPVINCRNGELWIKRNGRFELKPHRADSYLRHRLNVDYDPQAECADYDEAIEGIFAKATVEWPPIRPDTRRNRKGLGGRLGMRLCRTKRSGLRSSPDASAGDATLARRRCASSRRRCSRA